MSSYTSIVIIHKGSIAPLYKQGYDHPIRHRLDIHRDDDVMAHHMGKENL